MNNMLDIIQMKSENPNEDSVNHTTESVDVLLVDDREENLYTLETVLLSPEYNLIKAQSGDEALRYLLDHEPALILMDVQMPGLDGFETATLIKRNSRTREIPIIFVTAINKDERFTQKGYEHGAVDYVYKPYDPHILKSKVSVFVDLAKKTRRLFHAERQLRLSEKRERERQFAQLELRSLKREQIQQKKYLDLVDGIEHGVVWSADTESLGISFVSPSAEKLFGYPLNQWSREDSFLINHIHPDDQETTRSVIRQVIAEKINLDFEHRLIKADGSELWLHTGIHLASKGDGAGHELRALSIDITKIKEAEEVLRENKRESDFLSEASLALSSLDYVTILANIRRLIVPNISDLLIIYTMDENEILHGDLDEFDCEKIGIDPQQLGMDASEALKSEKILIPDHHHHGLHHIKSLMIPLVIRGKPFGVLTLLQCKSGRNFSKYDLTLMEDFSKRVCIAVDNSKLYQQAQAAIRARDDFFSIASHELKTPLTPLKLQTQILMRAIQNNGMNEIKPEKLNQILKTSDRQIGKLVSLIDSMMDISKISNGKLFLNPTQFDVVVLVKEVMDRFSNEISVAKCDATFDLKNVSSEHLIVFLDQFRIEQVVVNLLTNAIKYGCGKPIHVSLVVLEDRFTISFRDFGIGIAPKDQKRIFERFERAVTGATFSGLGLGLYIVKQIVDSHGGTIEINSQLGLGSTFTVELPIQYHHLVN